VREGYRRAQVKVLASRTEGYPKVLAEAMVHGCLPVAADVAINRQIVAEGERGATFPWGEPESLAAVLRGIIADPSRLAEQIRAGRAYTRGVTLEAFRDLHRQVLERQWGLANGGALS
jgi:glycosyltransferase involved in cell wall biosynthesis